MEITTLISLPFNKPYITLNGNSSAQIYVTDDLFRTFIYYFLCIEMLIVIPTVFGNGLILISTLKFRRLRRDMHVLVANLAVSDLLVGIVLIPLDTTLLCLQDQLNGNTKYLCLTTLSLNITFLLSSVLNLCLISIERYIAIVHPFAHSKMCSENRLLKVIAGSWTIAITIGVLPTIGWNNWRKSLNCDAELVLPLPYKALLDFLLIIVIITNTFMYTTVVRTAWRQIQRVTMEMTQVGDHDGSNQRVLKRDMRRTKVMIIILGVFIVCWSPYCICVLVNTFTDSQVTTVVGKFLFQLGLLNSGVNWLIFGLKNREFRQAFKQILKCSKIENDNSLTMTSSTDKIHENVSNQRIDSIVKSGLHAITNDKTPYVRSSKIMNFTVKPRIFLKDKAPNIGPNKNAISTVQSRISNNDTAPYIGSNKIKKSTFQSREFRKIRNVGSNGAGTTKGLSTVKPRTTR